MSSSNNEIERNLVNQHKMAEYQYMSAMKNYEEECKTIKKLRQALNDAEQRVKERKEILEQAQLLLTLVTSKTTEEKPNIVDDKVEN